MTLPRPRYGERYTRLASRLYIPPVLKFAGNGYPCPDCCCEPDCPNCDCCPSPTAVVITLDNITNISCEDCSLLNTSYQADWDAYYESTAQWPYSRSCVWEYTGLLTCNFDHLWLRLTRRTPLTPEKYTLEIWLDYYLGLGLGDIWWVQIIEGPVNCCTWNNYSVPFFAQGTNPVCDGTNATCKITALL